MKKTALIFGASQGIGLALTKNLLLDPKYGKVIATYRGPTLPQSLAAIQQEFSGSIRIEKFDAMSNEDSENLCQTLQKRNHALDLIVNCIGILKGVHTLPERSLWEVNTSGLMESFRINSITTLSLAKHLKPLLNSNGNPILVTLSAKVGSIEDNQTGGWYSYRISKAALNMAIKCLAIEWNRFAKTCTVFAIHPGTTETNLSSDFLESARKKYEVHSPEATALNIMRLVEDENVHEKNGKFISWDGTEVPW